MKLKRGVSDVITTVLIILLVLAAIVIVWQAVKNTVETGTTTLTGQTACMGVDLSIGTITTAGAVQITRNAGGDAAAITPVVLVAGTASTIASCTPIALATGLKQLETTTCTVGAIAPNAEVTVGAKMGTVTCPVTVKKNAPAA